MTLEWFCDRFGISRQIFCPYGLWFTGQEKIWIADHSCQALAESVFIPLETVGLPLVRRTPHSFKPTTVGLQRFGPYAQHQVATLDDYQCQQFMEGHSQTFDLINTEEKSLEHQGLSDPKQGFIHARSGPYELGCGRVKQDILYSEIPKVLRFADDGN